MHEVAGTADGLTEVLLQIIANKTACVCVSRLCSVRWHLRSWGRAAGRGCARLLGTGSGH